MKRILLAEDNEDAAELVVHVLTRFGYAVEVAKDGIEVVEKAVAWHPDLVVMDMMMPRVNGFQAATQLRQNPQTSEIRILAATAMAGEDAKRRCLESGCDEYISKPYSQKHLAATIERLV
jgi:CheY-like chemotaxis protein